ncbi:ABC transporter substrate-binding protein [Bombilactobacillus thymidiniphilus]|uniref:ABC transporter substrate-binding protein n=2 Tax=Bombilactobacillus thymidiniphilus TaxID=2923363 RepID=A0ABY4PFK5_9LACO|nr:tryptophan ABC transporter substrate-binding protein [Bombilactobacillus thymidiniphilus]UQS84367.1 ABC transporter substrate-binding protein [Bombilactobacillus thymidiniphilus]
MQSPKNNTTQQVPTIGILQLVNHPALNDIHRGIIAGLKQEGYTPNKNIKIDYQNAQNDQSNLKTMSQKFIDNNDALVVGIATPAAQSLAKAANQKTPVILGGITDPVGGHLIKSERRPGNNVTGTSGESPLKEQLNLIQQLFPQAQRIGIIYTTSDKGGEYNAKKFAKLCQKNNLQPKLFTIANTNDMQQIAQTMSRQVDVVYAPQDNGVASAMKTLVAVTNKAKISVIPAVDTMVKDGGIATVSTSQFAVGKATGKIAAQVLKGRAPKTYPIKFLTHGQVVLNFKEAKQLDIKFPHQLIHNAQQKGVIFK